MSDTQERGGEKCELLTELHSDASLKVDISILTSVEAGMAVGVRTARRGVGEKAEAVATSARAKADRIMASGC